MAYFQSGDLQLYYEDHGGGEDGARGYSVVLSHGMGESTGLWTAQVEALAPHYRLITWDNRGHGRSEAPDGQEHYSIPHFADDLRALLDHLGIERACVVGHSMGGYTTIAFAIEHPERLAALVLADTAPGEETIPNRPPAERAIRERLPLEELARREGMAAVALRQLADGTVAPEVARDPAQRAQYIERMARLPVNGFIWAWRALRYRPSYTGRLGEIAAPTLCVAGERDDFLPAVRLLAERIPRADLVVIPDAGHTANREQPEAFNRALLGFLAQVAAPSAARSRAP